MSFTSFLPPLFPSFLRPCLLTRSLICPTPNPTLPPFFSMSVCVWAHLKTPFNLSSGQRIPPGGEAHGGVRPPDWHNPAATGDHRQQDQGGEGEAGTSGRKALFYWLSGVSFTLYVSVMSEHFQIIFVHGWGWGLYISYILCYTLVDWIYYSIGNHYNCDYIHAVQYIVKKMLNFGHRLSLRDYSVFLIWATTKLLLESLSTSIRLADLNLSGWIFGLPAWGNEDQCLKNKK